jgi:AraC-like DNA-binding protein
VRSEKTTYSSPDKLGLEGSLQATPNSHWGTAKDADQRIHSVQTMAAYGLTTIRSSYGPEETMNRFEAEVMARGMIAFAHNQPLAEIALALNFSSQANFTRAFRREFGITPGRYREQKSGTLR